VTVRASARRLAALLLATAGVAGAGAAQPSNDSCSGAIPIGDGLSPLFSNGNAIDPISAGMCTPANSDVWFRYAPSGSGSRTFSTCGTGGTLDDTVLQVIEAATCFSVPTTLGCNDDACGTLRSSVTVSVTALTNYYIRVAGYGTSGWTQGTFRILVSGPAPPNDHCVGAIEVFAPGGVANHSNLFATTSGTVANFCNIPFNSDVWFKWIATCTGTATFATCGDPTPAPNSPELDDTVLQVLSGTCGSLVGLGQNCNDDACGSNGLKSSVSVPVTAGTTYFIRVAASGSGPTDWGTFTLSIDCCPGGAFTSIPTGCGSPAFTPVLTATGTSCLGGWVTYTFLPAPAGWSLIWVGFPTSIPLCPPEPCTVGASLSIVLPTNTFSAAIPYDPALSGLVLAVQGAGLGMSFGCPASAYGIPFTVSNTIQMTIG
jgi:hypothetical protein